MEPPRLRSVDSSTTLLVVIVVVALAVGALAFYPFGPQHSHRSACLSNVKQLATAAILYESDAGTLPPDQWETRMASYSKSKEMWRCPEAKNGAGYAMNVLTRGRPLSTDPEQALLFDIEEPGSSQYARTVQPVSRHENRLAVAFSDSHAKWISNEKLASIRMTAKPSR